MAATKIVPLRPRKSFKGSESHAALPVEILAPFQARFSVYRMFDLQESDGDIWA